MPASLQVTLGFALILAVMSVIQFAGPGILDNDGYYHIRWSRMLREAAPGLPPFKALPLTELNEEDYADHHFLYHVGLSLFTVGDLRVGAKLAAVVFSSAALATLFGLLVAYRVPYRWLWLVPLVASSEPFLYRMSMTRAQSVSLLMLGIGTYLIFRRRLVLLALLSLAFVWSYSLFPLLILFALVHSIAVYLGGGRIDLSAPAASALGSLAGLIVNPYFPNNLELLWRHLQMKLPASYPVNVGVEWYSYPAWVLIGGSAVAFAVYFAGLVAFDFKSRNSDYKPLFFLIVSTVLLLMTFKSRRFIEYWPPFAVLFAAFTMAPRLERVRLIYRKTRDRAIAAIAASVLVTTLTATMAMTVLNARRSISREPDPFEYRGASEWLAQNTPPGTMVFNTDWDDFPMLFYYNPANVYATGLDPGYMFNRDADLWKLNERITLGDESNPAPLILERFGARYVFTPNGHRAFLRIAEASGDFEVVYGDRHATVLRIKGGPED